MDQVEALVACIESLVIMYVRLQITEILMSTLYRNYT